MHFFHHFWDRCFKGAHHQIILPLKYTWKRPIKELRVSTPSPSFLISFFIWIFSVKIKFSKNSHYFIPIKYTFSATSTWTAPSIVSIIWGKSFWNPSLFPLVNNFYLNWAYLHRKQNLLFSRWMLPMPWRRQGRNLTWRPIFRRPVFEKIWGKRLYNTYKPTVLINLKKYTGLGLLLFFFFLSLSHSQNLVPDYFWFSFAPFSSSPFLRPTCGWPQEVEAELDSRT